MKRKYLAIYYLLILIIGTIASLYIPKQENVQADTGAVVIPNEAIRLRILANSDQEADQAVKRLIRDEVNRDITKWVANLTSIDEARKVITSHLDEIQATAEKVMKKEGVHESVKVNFGQAEFPTKLYGQYLYPAGKYEAVIITLGEGAGANWWCVLFPPLCFLDFSNGTAVSKSPFEEEKGSSHTSNQVKTEDGPNGEMAKDTQQQTNQPVTKEKTVPSAPKEPIIEKDINPQTDKLSTNTETKRITETSEPANNQKAQLYNGQEEPKIIKKSLFAELFSSLF